MSGDLEFEVVKLRWEVQQLQGVVQDQAAELARLRTQVAAALALADEWEHPRRKRNNEEQDIAYLWAADDLRRALGVSS